MNMGRGSQESGSRSGKDAERCGVEERRKSAGGNRKDNARSEGKSIREEKPVPERSAGSQIREIELEPISAPLDDAAKWQATVFSAKLSDLH